MTEPTLREVLASRTATYQLLSRLFRVEVDQECYDELLSMSFPANTGNAKVDAGYASIRRYLASPHPSPLTELAVDYTRTFIGGGNNGYSAAYPFESVYTSPKRLLMQGARDEVLVAYRSAGIDKKPSWKEGEDHIALELEFMQILGMRALDALCAGDEDAAADHIECQKGFLVNHVGAWFPMMAADMRKFSKTDFYRGLADLTAGFLETDREFLCDVLEDDEPAESFDEAVVIDL
ncbi:molecular chaperone [Adlercreutzia sp. ZJ242]|uniref:TorD/DmsD family molecular chaperone n=1 Tax=Adlercreutzia sp. ZJ242 TaxID=2709409 RepID=UPI0013EC883B|nr:molecular chaperone TorD family protein [Adlercreutzia sp. ZJ242]